MTPPRVATLFLLLAALLLPQESAEAQELSAEMVTRFAGLPVISVEFEAPEGFDSEQLRYLVEQDVGRPYSPQAISRSVELLFRLGQFDDVRAMVSETAEGLTITFRLVPSPRVKVVRLRGLRRLQEGSARAVLSLGAGDPYVAQAERRLARELEEHYRSRGFLDVKVAGRVRGAHRGGVVIDLRVEEGPAYKIGRIKVPPREVAGFEGPKIARMLSPRLYEGKVFREDDLREAVTNLLEDYRSAGFVEARLLSAQRPKRGQVPVNIEIDRAAKRVIISLPIEAGRLVGARFNVDGSDAPLHLHRSFLRVIGLESAQRASQAYVDDAARQLERYLWRLGYFHARVDANVDDVGYAPPPGLPHWARPVVSKQRQLTFDVDRGPRVLLERANFSAVGNELLTEQELLGVLGDASPAVLGNRPLLATLIGIPIHRRFYTEGELEEALSVLKDYYRARGYLDAQIESSAGVPDQDGRPGRLAKIHLDIVEGTQTMVESLEVDFELELDEGQRQEWRERVEGKAFNPAQLDELVREAREALEEKGFVDAKVESSQELSEDRTLVRLQLKARQGTEARFGQILVRESKYTHVELIRREISDRVGAVIRAGELFRPSTLQEAQARLLRTGLFDGVLLRPAQRTGQVRDLEVLVNERKRFSLTLGAGVTWPDDGPRVSGEVRLRNLDGRGLSVFARGRLGLDWRYLGAETVRGDYRASMGVELPYFPGVPMRASIFGVIGEEIDEPTFRVRRSEVGAALIWRGSERFSFEARGLLQFRTPLRVDSVARLSLPADQPIADAKVSDFQLLPFFTFTGSLDLRDDRFNPRRGAYIDLGFETTIGQIGEDYPAFGRLTSRVVGLVPFGPKDLGLRVEVGGGVAWSYDGRLPPVEYRFGLGGTGTLRGFALDAVGPTGSRPGLLQEVGLLQGVGLDERDVAVGGNAFYRYSVELLMPIVFLDSWRFAVFHDAGNALIYGETPAGIDNGRLPVLHTSLGIGLRRITPIGPLRFDVAVRPDTLIEVLGDGVEHPVGSVVQVHFALGAL